MTDRGRCSLGARLFRHRVSFSPRKLSGRPRFRRRRCAARFGTYVGVGHDRRERAAAAEYNAYRLCVHIRPESNLAFLLFRLVEESMRRVYWLLLFRFCQSSRFFYYYYYSAPTSFNAAVGARAVLGEEFESLLLLATREAEFSRQRVHKAVVVANGVVRTLKDIWWGGGRRARN